MDAAMFQLRSFVHQRLYSAAEEILMEVQRTLTLAVREAEVRGCNGEAGGLQHRLQETEPLLTCSPVDQADEKDVSLLQEDPGPSSPEEPKEPNYSLSAEVPGPSTPSAVLDNDNYCFVQTNFKMSVIKEEQEEFGDGSQTQGEVYLPPEIVKSENPMSYEMQPVSSDCSVAQNEDTDHAEELGRSKVDHIKAMAWKGKILQVESGSMAKTRQAVLPHNSQKNEKARSFCHLCGKGFQYIGSLMKHIKTHETNSECTVCGVTCKSTNELINHLKGRHNKTHFCDICGKTFANIRCLRLHERIHSGMKEFMCQECGKTFHRREHLIVHVRTHSGEKPYHCDICGKAFSQSQNLTIHKRSHSGEKPYHCALCGKLFNTSSHLKTHMRYHSGEKPYPCDICGKCFRQSGQMTRHRTTHTGERPYACQVCGMRYRFAPNLKVHMQTHEIAATE